uniref:Uncharacterized protein n=1 Tax=Panagrolaimus davidi TaxID=227884 RepID=A0A914PAV8_9BILA
MFLKTAFVYIPQPYKKKLRHWQEDDEPESEVETAEEFIDNTQIHKYLSCLEEGAGRSHRVKYFSLAELRSANRALFENKKFIIVLIPMGDSRSTLAIFDLQNSSCWKFLTIANEKNRGFQDVKSILENALDTNFKLLRNCDKIFNVRGKASNDVIHMFHLCEKLFLTGQLVPIQNLEIKAERRRVAAIFDLINSPRWNHVWPSTLRNELQADPSDENLAPTIEHCACATQTPVFPFNFFSQ